jgi:crotonobetainyl-CoA:carnitine CoA-transferase CaiB-like acyl-CoA transferase
MANPAKLSHTPEKKKMPAPLFGEHTQQVISELGYTSEEINKLREKQVIN